MQKLVLLKDIYLEAFRNWSNIFLQRYFKVFFVFCMIMMAVVTYAFIFRLFTGFAFD